MADRHNGGRSSQRELGLRCKGLALIEVCLALFERDHDLASVTTRCTKPVPTPSSWPIFNIPIPPLWSCLIRLWYVGASVSHHNVLADEVISDGVTNLPMLLDFLTVFFIVTGCALLWLNLRRRRPRIVVTKTDDGHQSAPARHISDDAEIRALLAALKPPAPEAQSNPEDIPPQGRDFRV